MRVVSVALLLAAACGGSGKDWVKQLPSENDPVPDPGWNSSPTPEHTADPLDDSPAAGPRSLAPVEASPVAPERVSLVDDVFRNTYYDFPRELAGPRDATIYDASCTAIVRVTKTFHDQLCVQGSGKTASGATVSFAKRGCACAAMCPRTGQQICFEKLDPKAFPSGRGAMGKAITPLRTVAVDVSVIALGTKIFIPESVGLPRPDGSLHDGCFVAEDRGLRVVGRQVDIFTGDPSVTAQWNKLLPSNRGVHVKVDEPRCK